MRLRVGECAQLRVVRRDEYRVSAWGCEEGDPSGTLRGEVVDLLGGGVSGGVSWGEWVCGVGE